MESVSQLDQNDTNIFGHRQGHFLKVFGLSLFGGVEFDMGQLTHTVHQIGDIRPKLCTNILFGDASILDDVMEQRGHEALCIHMHARQNAGHGKGMRDIRLATAPCLPVVCLLRVVIGSPDQFYLF